MFTYTPDMCWVRLCDSAFHTTDSKSAFHQREMSACTELCIQIPRECGVVSVN